VIYLKSDDEIEKIRKAGIVVAKTLTALIEMVAPGITTQQLDEKAAKTVNMLGAKCAFYGYRGFPKNICTSVNEEVVHGIPGERVLKEADIISIDVGAELDGYYADAAVTVGVGRVSAEAKKLIEVTKKALYKGIEKATLENRLYDISYAVQGETESNGFSVVRDFVGHGIGKEMHEDPQIPNFGQPHTGVNLKHGMVLAIEPMVNIGTHKIEILKDGWTAVTADRKISAHFEHTIAVTDNGPEILTKG
jgi:methionyl aminopeptidase